jgi:hypothetical protein
MSTNRQDPQMQEPNPARLAAARAGVQSFLVRKRRWTVALFWLAALCEISLFGAMLWFMDFQDRFHWFLFFGFSGVYVPIVLMTLRNSMKIDELYYRLTDELLRERRGPPPQTG